MKSELLINSSYLNLQVKVEVIRIHYHDRKSMIKYPSTLSKVDEDIKGTRWMPWHKKAMKDVASCDKLRGAAHRL